MHLDWWTIGLQTINFAILVWLLRRFLYKPVLRMIDARKAEIQRQYDAAKAAEEKAQRQLAGVEADRAGIEAERTAALQDAARQAQAMMEARRSQSQREAQALLDGTRKTLVAERERALDEARRMAIDLGAEFAQKLLAQMPVELRAEGWIERIEQYVDALAKPEREALCRQLADGSPLAVVTASPLPAASAAAWRERLQRLFGTTAAIAFDVDAALIAGAELRFPTAVLRFSWQSALAAARSEIGAHV